MTEPTAILAAELTADPGKLIAGMQAGATATSAYAQAAARHMTTAQASFNGLNFSVVTSKAKAEQVQLVALQHQLDVARASGEKNTVRALEEEITLLSRVRQLRSLGFKPDDAQAAAKAQMAALSGAAMGATSNLNRAQLMELTHVAKSLFDQISAGASPLRALQVEGGRIAQIFAEGEGGVGGTFKALTGLINPMTVGVGAAAAAFITLAVVMGHVHEAAQEIVDLKVSSDKLGIPVEELQLWQFIAAQTHVSNQQLDQSFEGLTATLGKLKSGIREQRIQPFIDELGISDADIAKANNAADLMELIISKMEKIKDPGERTQIADAFGMQAALPLLSRTRGEIQGMTEDFARNAGVISGEQADALDKQEQALNRAHALMHDKIRADLAELAPLVGSLAVAWESVSEAAIGALADMVRAGSFRPGMGAGGGAPPVPHSPVGVAGDLLHEVGSVVFGRPGGMAADYVTSMFERFANQGDAHPAAVIPHGSPAAGAGGGARMLQATKATEDLNKALAEYVTHTSHAAEMTKRIAEDRKNGATITPQQEASLMAAARAQDAKAGEGAARGAQAAANKAMEETKASDDAISAAKKEELKARIALTADMMADHQLKLQELAEERDRKDRQANQDAALGKISGGARDQVVAANDKAYGEGVDLENRRFGQEAADQARTYADELRRYQIAHLTATAQLASNTQQWADDTRRAFALQQQSERADFVDRTQKRTTESGPNHLSADQATTEIHAFDAGQADALARSNREIDEQVLAKRRQFADQLDGYSASVLQAEAAMAQTSAQRRELEQRILDIRQAQAREELETQIRTNHTAPADAQMLRSGLQRSQAAEQSQFDDQHQDPWGAWVKSGEKASADVGDALEAGAVRGFDQLNSGVAEAIANGKTMGDVFKSVFRSMEADALQYLLKQAEIGIFGGGASGAPGLGSLITGGLGLFGGGGGLPGVVAGSGDAFKALDAMTLPAFAGGTDDTPGGETIYNEKGTEGYVPPGAQIIPNDTLRGLAQLSPDRLGGGPATMNHTVKIDLTGANGDETIRQIAHEAAAAGTLQAISYSNSKLKGVQRASGRSLTRF